MKKSHSPLSFAVKNTKKLFILPLLAATLSGQAQVNISAGTSYTQNFSGMGTTATSALPTGWKADKSTSVRTVGSYAAAGAATEQLGGNNISQTATNGIYNFLVGTNRAIGGISSSSASKSVNVYLDLLNNGSGAITNLQISYNIKKFRSGSNPAGFSMTLYYSTNGTTWTAAGSNFLTSFTPDADNSGFSPAPGAVTAVSNQTLTISIAASSHLYLAWNYSPTSGSTSSNAQGLGVGDINITALGAAAPVCNDPTGLAANNVTSTTADLSWNTQSGVTGYEYVVNQTAADPAAAGTATTGVSTSASGLTPGTVYYLHVRTNCGSSNFSNWATQSFTTTVAACNAPSGLAANNITPTSADLSWNTQPGVTGYEYTVDQTAATPSASGTATTNTTVTNSTLTANSVYYLHVRTNCGSGNLSTWTTVSFTTTIPPCADPTGLAANNITPTSADLSWNIQAGVAGYEYTVDQTAAAPTASGTATTNTTVTNSTLTANTVYYLHVRTNCGLNFSNWTTVSFTTTIPPCSAPTGLAANNITPTSADLSWNTQAGVAGYEYTVDQTAAAPTASGTATTNTTVTNSTLTANTVYYLHVRTNCGLNFSNWTTISFTTTIPPCAAPTGLAANNITSTSADLSWTAQAGVAGYEYTVDQTATAPSAAGTTTTGVSTSTTGLTPNTVYYLHVRTNCGLNFSNWTTISFTTTIPPCATPTGLAANNITPTNADLSWSTQSGVAGYEYTVDQTATAPSAAGTATTGVSTSTTGLTPNTVYYLHVRTNCGLNFSNWTTISFTTTIPPCAAPTGLAANNITPTSADLSWTAQSGVAGYEYTVDQTATAPSAAGTTTTGVSTSTTGLTPNTVYYLHVRTNCGLNFSSWTTVSFTTTIPPCSAPTGLAANNITPTSADLSWSTQSGVAGYEYTLDQTATAPSAAGTATTGVSTSTTSLTPNTVYYLHVRTNCGLNLSSWTTISFTTTIPPCSAPTGLAANNITPTSADLSWTAQTGVAGYEYKIDQTATAPSTSGTATTGVSTSTTGLTPNTVYYLHVRTNCGSNLSSWTTISFTTSIATGIDEAKANMIASISPNPVNEMLTVSLIGKPNGPATVSIIDLTGKTLRTEEMTDSSIQLNVSALSPGLYFIKVSNDQVAKTYRFIRN